MAAAKDQYGTPDDVSVTLDSLATATYNESAVIVPTSDTLVARTLQVAWKLTAGTSPTAGTYKIYLAKTMPAAGVAPVIHDGGATGAEGTGRTVDPAQMDLLKTITVGTGTGTVYQGSILVDGVPPGSTLLVWHDSVAAWGSSGNDISVRQVPVTT